MLRSFLLFSLFFIVLSAHNCVHDQWNQPLIFVDTGGPDSANFRPGEGRSLQQTYESIRIHVDFSFIQGYDEKIVNFIQYQLVPSAVSFFESTLNIIRLTTNLKVKSSCYDLGPPDYLLTTGIAADLVIIIVLDQLDMTVLARSGACALSSVNSRPVYGALIFNSNNFPTETVTDQEQALVTTIHEMTHILGFSSNVYPFYIDPTTGKRRTGHVGNITIDGQIANFLDLEPLTNRLKVYFGCDTVVGAYLENQGGDGTVGSHFERRIFMNDLMTATFVANPIVSQFTLAALEGTGWYMPNYNMAETFTWGQGQGCPFLNGSCIDENDKPNFPQFCEFLTENGCSYTGRGKAACGVAAGSMKISPSLAAGWDRWHNKTIMTDFYGDNCPYYWSPIWEDCENPSNKGGAFIKEEVYGDRSRCFVGNLTHSDSQTGQAGYCFSTECYNADYDYGYILVVTVGEETVECTQQGPITVQGLNGIIECPDPNIFCADYSPTSCARGCLGRGECRSDRCLCSEGWGGRDCGLRVTDDNCDRCSHEKINKGCYGDICQPNTYSDDMPYGSTDEYEVDINEEGILTEENEWNILDGEPSYEYGWENEVDLKQSDLNNLYFKQDPFCDSSSCMKWD